MRLSSTLWLTPLLSAWVACGVPPDPLEDERSAVGGRDRPIYQHRDPARLSRDFDIAEAADGSLLTAYVVNVPGRGHRLVVARSTDAGVSWTPLWEDLVYARIGALSIATADGFSSTRWPNMVHVAAQLIHTSWVQQPDGTFREVSQQESLALFSGPSDQPWRQYGWANTILPAQPTIPFADWQVALTVLPADNAQKDYAVGVTLAYPEGAANEWAIYLAVASDPATTFNNFEDPNGARKLAGAGGEVIDAPGRYSSPDIAADPGFTRAMVAFGERASGVVSVGQLEGARFNRASLLHQTGSGYYLPSIAAFDGSTYFTARRGLGQVAPLELHGELFTGQGFGLLDVATHASMSRADLWAGASQIKIAVLAEEDRNQGASYPAVYGLHAVSQAGGGFRWSQTRANDFPTGQGHRPRLAATDETFRVAYHDGIYVGLETGANLHLDP